MTPSAQAFPEPAPDAQDDAERTKLLAELAVYDQVVGTHRAIGVAEARQDFTAFVAYCFTDPKRGTPIRQGEFHVELQTAIDRHPFVFAELPRGHGKTSQVVVYRVLWWLGHNPDERIKIACETDRQARKRIREVAEHITRNPRLQEVFPHLRPADLRGWTKQALYVERSIVSKDASVEAYGIGSGVIGDRATKLIFDDVTRPRSVRSPAAREEVKDAVYGVWLPMVEEDFDDAEDLDALEAELEAEVASASVEDDAGEVRWEDLASEGSKPDDGLDKLPDPTPDRAPLGGQVIGYVGPEGAWSFDWPRPPGTGETRVVWIGTPWHTDDPHSELKAKAVERGWFPYCRSIGDERARKAAAARGEPDDDYAPIWPETWPRIRILSRKKRLPSAHFARAYHCIPMSDEDKVWHATDFRHISWADFHAIADDDGIIGIVSAWDFAFTEDTRNDWTAYCCVALDDEDNIYVFRAEHFRAKLDPTARTMIRWWKRDGADHVGYEKVNAQVWIGQYVRLLRRIPLRKLEPKVGKWERAVQTQPFVEQGGVYFLPGTEDLQAEMEAFPVGKHDDLVDVFVYCVLQVIEFYLLDDGDDGDDDGDDDEDGDDDGDVYEDDGARVTVIGGADDDDLDADPEAVLDRLFDVPED